MTPEQAELLAGWRVWCDEQDAWRDHWKKTAENFRAAGFTGIDPTHPVAHGVSFYVYEE